MSTPAPTGHPNVGQAELRGVTLHFWHIWYGDMGTAMQQLVDAFNASNQWGIRVEAAYQGNLDDLSGAVDKALEGGTPPDLAIGYSYQAFAWSASNKVVDLNEYVNDPTWGLSAQEQDDFYPVFWQHELMGGKRWGLPAQPSGQFLFYNVSWARELGFDAPPTTPEDFTRQACAAAQANKRDDNTKNDGTGGWIISTDYSAILGWIEAFNGTIVRPDGNGYQFNTPQVSEAFTYLRGLYDQGCAWLSQDQAPDSDFANRRGLFATGSVMDIPYLAAAFKQAGSADQWTVIPFPSPVGKPAIDVYGPAYVMFSSTPERQLAAWLFLKWLVEPQNQADLIQASSSFPSRVSAGQALDQYRSEHPQWAVALDLLDDARPEPSLQSWGTIRWAVHDAATQLFRYYFEINQVPSLVKLLDETAAELHTGGH